jgi:hypothetical protein
MKNKWNRKTAVLAAAAVILLAGTTLGRAMAYFTTYVIAEGGRELELGFTTTVPAEEIREGAKLITIQNTGSNDCYVRVKVFAGSMVSLTFAEGESDLSWTAGKDGYYYWKRILQAGPEGQGEVTGTLKIKIDCGDTTMDSFNVIVVQECTPVTFDENGEPLTWDKVDWDRTADVIKTETPTTIRPGTPDPESQPDIEDNGEGNP